MIMIINVLMTQSNNSLIICINPLIFFLMMIIIDDHLMTPCHNIQINEIIPIINDL